MKLFIEDTILKYYKPDPGETELTIPDGVTAIEGGTFSDGTALEHIILPDSVTRIAEWAFFRCTALKSIILPSHITAIAPSTFRECLSLTQFTIPEDVTEIGKSAFDSCTGMTQAVIPQGLTRIEEYTFWECSNLEQLTIPPGIVHIGEDALYKCHRLRVIKLHPDDPAIHRDYGKIRKLENLIEAALAMLRTGGYTANIDRTVKLPFLILHYFHTGDKALEQYLTENLNIVMAESISAGDTEIIRFMAETNRFLTGENIDRFILMAQQYKQHGITAFLLDYKNRNFGFSLGTDLL